MTRRRRHAVAHHVLAVGYDVSRRLSNSGKGAIPGRFRKLLPHRYWPNLAHHRKYSRPTPTTKLRNYFFDGFGPYSIVGAAFAAGINQAGNTPPERKQGAEGYERDSGPTSASRR